MSNPSEILREALAEVLSFQSSGKSPTIHDYGRWRRALEGRPSLEMAPICGCAPGDCAEDEVGPGDLRCRQRHQSGAQAGKFAERLRNGARLSKGGFYAITPDEARRIARLLDTITETQRSSSGARSDDEETPSEKP